jgi:hypothetical protein
VNKNQKHYRNAPKCFGYIKKYRWRTFCHAARASKAAITAGAPMVRRAARASQVLVRQLP